MCTKKEYFKYKFPKGKFDRITSIIVGLYKKRGDFVKTNCVYTVSEIAEILKVSKKTVYGLIHDRKLECVWVKGQIRITSGHLENYLGGIIGYAQRNER